MHDGELATDCSEAIAEVQTGLLENECSVVQCLQQVISAAYCILGFGLDEDALYWLGWAQSL